MPASRGWSIEMDPLSPANGRLLALAVGSRDIIPKPGARLVRRERRLRGGQSRSLPCEQPVRLEDRALPGVRVSQEHRVRQMRSQYEFATGFISSQMPFTTNDPRSVRLKPAPNRELLPSRPRPPPAHPSLCSCRSRERHHACRRRLLSLSGCGKRVCLRVRERGIILRGFRAALCNAIT